MDILQDHSTDDFTFLDKWLKFERKYIIQPLFRFISFFHCKNISYTNIYLSRDFFWQYIWRYCIYHVLLIDDDVSDSLCLQKVFTIIFYFNYWIWYNNCTKIFLFFLTEWLGLLSLKYVKNMLNTQFRNVNKTKFKKQFLQLVIICRYLCDWLQITSSKVFRKTMR